MSTEINTRGMVRSKAPGFPSGNDAECLSRPEITTTGKALVNGSYGDNECPVIEDVVKKESIINYIFINLMQEGSMSTLQAHANTIVTSYIQIRTYLERYPGDTIGDAWINTLGIGEEYSRNTMPKRYGVISSTIISADRDDNYIYQLQIV